MMSNGVVIKISHDEFIDVFVKNEDKVADSIEIINRLLLNKNDENC